MPRMAAHQPDPTATQHHKPLNTPLERALDQNETVKDAVAQSAAELLVINTVLKQEILDHLQTGDIEQALQKTDALESKISEAVADIAQVNQALGHEIDERAHLERELAATQAALATLERSQLKS